MTVLGVRGGRAASSLAVRLATVVAVLALVACSDSSKVGEGLEVKQGAEGANCRLGECTTTTSTTSTTLATTTTTRPGGPPAAARPTTTTTTTAPPTTTTTAPRQATFVIKIQSDTASGGQFLPRVATVRVGTLVRWTNTDTSPRSVEADEGQFASPPIPPGGSYDYRAEAGGSFNYHDGTRPYAVGTLQVN
jgi:plastocyanin